MGFNCSELSEGTQAFLLFPHIFNQKLLWLIRMKKKDKVAASAVEFHLLSAASFKVSACGGFIISMLWLWSWILVFLAQELGGSELYPTLNS